MIFENVLVHRHTKTFINVYDVFQERFNRQDDNYRFKILVNKLSWVLVKSSIVSNKYHIDISVAFNKNFIQVLLVDADWNVGGAEFFR